MPEIRGEESACWWYLLSPDDKVKFIAPSPKIDCNGNTRLMTRHDAMIAIQYVRGTQPYMLWCYD